MNSADKDRIARRLLATARAVLAANPPRDRIRLAKGQGIQIGGIPLVLESDVIALGRKENLDKNARWTRLTISENPAFGDPDVLYDIV